MSYFKHALALVESSRIGDDTRIWAWAHILPEAVLGRNCNICDHTFIENDVVLGNNVTVKCGVYLWDGIIVEDDVFIGPAAVFSNDRYPRSGNRNYKQEKIVLRRGCSIGAGAILLPGIEIGENAMVGAGAVVTKSVPAYALVVGNPAHVVRYLNKGEEECR